MDSDKFYRRQQPRLMIIPMIDIIFFLLVFFMMSTLYMVDQQLIPVRLPQAQSAQTETVHSIPITVTTEGKILFDKEEISPELLQVRAKSELHKQNDSIFILRADKQAEYGKVVTVLDTLKLAGAQHISIATERKEN